MRKVFVLAFAALPIALLAGCGGGGFSVSPTPVITVSISPPSASLVVAQTTQFRATVTGTSNRAVTWSVNGVAGGDATIGTVDANGLYTAPAIPPTPNVLTVRAASVADPARAATASVTVVNPTPTLGSITPTTIDAGSPDTTLTLMGTGFTSQSTAHLGGVPLVTAFGDSTQLAAIIPAAQLANAGILAVTVVTPSPGGGASGAVNFAVWVVVSVTPSALTLDVGQTQQFTAIVTGSVNQSVAWSVNGIAGGDATVGTIDSSGLYAAAVVPSSPNTVTVTATSAVDTARGASAPVTVVNPFPSIQSISPSSIKAASADTTLTIAGMGFAHQSVVQLGATPLATTFGNSSQLTAVIPSAQLTTTGTFPVTVVTPSPGGGSSAPETLTVNQEPAIISASTATFTVGAAGSLTVTATGFPPPTLSETGTLPGGVTFNAVIGALSGIPGAGTGGTYNITFTASNGVGTKATQTFTLTVDEAPAITSASTATFTVGTAGSFTLLTATGFPKPTLSDAGTLPSGVTFNATTGVLSGTPGASTGGTYGIAFTASNGVGTNATQDFTLTVNQAPAITSASDAAFTVGAAGSSTLTATGFPTPTLGESGALPSGLTFNASTGELSGTPVAGTGGTYSLTLTASNGVGTNATQNFTLTVNQPPAITSAASTTLMAGTAGSFTVTTTGFPTPTLSESGALPSGVTFNTATGALSGTPGAGTGGTNSITFTASNGVGTSAAQNFTLTVNEAPAVTSASNATFTVATAGSFTVTATGFPTPTLSETGTLPSGVTFNAATGVLDGTPGAGTGDTYPITFTASNGVGTNATQNFALTVNQAPAITSANNTTFSVGTAGSFTVTATGFPTPTLSETGALPSGVTFNAATGLLGGTPGPNAGGIRSITFTASNGVGTNATQTFTLTVNNPGPTITFLSPAAVNAGGPSTTITVNGTGFDQQSTVAVDETPVITTFSGSSTQLGAVVPAAKLAISGTLQITVVTPSPGGGTSNGVGLTVVTTVRVSPSAPTLSLNQTRQFSATVAGISDQSVTWFVDDLPGGNLTLGTISIAGLYITPGSLPSPQTVTVKAASVADPTKSGISNVTVSYPASDNYPRAGAGSILRTSPPLTKVPITGSAFAVLDWTSKDGSPSEEELLSICNTLSPLGIPHVHTTDLSVADNYPFLAVAGVFGTNLTNPERNALLTYVQNGGILFLWGLNDQSLMTTLGAGMALTPITGTTLRPLTLDVPNVDPALTYIDDPKEINWSMWYLDAGRTWHYVPVTAQELATWESGDAALLRSDYGSGRAYIFGWRPRHIVSDPQRLISPEGIRWTNFPVLDADIQKMLLRGVYEDVAGVNAQLRQFAPNGKQAALVLTHDIDDITSYELAPTFAQFEDGLGVKSTYNFTTSPYDTGWVETFYDATGRQEIQEALNLGMDVESHSIGHFPDFDLAPFGTGAETAENYMPRYSSTLAETIGFSTLGELGVSRWLLENDFGVTVEGFRSGYLAVPNDFPEALRQTGYRRDSSYAAGVTRGSFPFVLFGASGGIVTTYPLVEYPVGISDDQHDLDFIPDNYTTYLNEWKAAITANYYNNAPTVLLIHPVSGNFDLRQQLEQDIIQWATSTYPDMWVGNWKTFGQFWEAQGVTCDKWP